MNRRHWSLVFWSLAVVVATGAIACSTAFGSQWTKNPTITVVSEANDPRREAVRAAVAYWNRTFAELGTPFRFGEVDWVTDSVPDSDIQALARQVRFYNPWPVIPDSIERHPGDLIIVLSNAKFISFTEDGSPVESAGGLGRATRRALQTGRLGTHLRCPCPDAAGRATIRRMHSDRSRRRRIAGHSDWSAVIRPVLMAIARTAAAHH
jgi:hypothetical protein